MRKHQKINLIPKSHAAPPPVSVDQLIVFGVFAALLSCALHFYRSYTEVRQLSAELQQVTAKQADITNRIKEATSTIAQSTVVDEQEKLIRTVVSHKPNWADAFKELSLVVPRETWLSELLLNNKDGHLAVKIKGETSSQANMADFLASLERSEFFNNVLMVQSTMSNKTTPPLYSFEFAAPGLTEQKKEAKR